eukprot:20793-Karenia_brevis.AAC.1
MAQSVDHHHQYTTMRFLVFDAALPDEDFKWAPLLWCHGICVSDHKCQCYARYRGLLVAHLHFPRMG